jgi:hypothetical protein
MRIQLSYRLAEWPTLTDGNLIANLETERGTDMDSCVGVSLLVTRVLWNEVEIFPANDSSTMHLCRYHSSSHDTTTD